jgi:hypothetical protein
LITQWEEEKEEHQVVVIQVRRGGSFQKVFQLGKSPSFQTHKFSSVEMGEGLNNFSYR